MDRGHRQDRITPSGIIQRELRLDRALFATIFVSILAASPLQAAPSPFSACLMPPEDNASDKDLVDHQNSCLEALRGSNGNPRLKISLARTWNKLKQHRNALNILAGALYTQPLVPGDKLFNLLSTYGDALRGLNQYEAALRAYQLATKMGKETPSLLMSKGETLRDLGRFTESVDTLTKAVDKFKSEHGTVSAEFWATLGESQLASGDNILAEQSVSLALKTDPSHPQGLSVKAKLLRGTARSIDDRRHALTALEAAGDAGGRDGNWWLSWARLHVEGGLQQDDPAKVVCRAIANNGPAVELYPMLAKALIKAGRAEEARGALERATTLNPNEWKLWVKLGDLSLEQKQTSSAIWAYRNAAITSGKNNVIVDKLRRSMLQAEIPSGLTLDYISSLREGRFQVSRSTDQSYNNQDENSQGKTITATFIGDAVERGLPAFYNRITDEGGDAFLSLTPQIAFRDPCFDKDLQARSDIAREYKVLFSDVSRFSDPEAGGSETLGDLIGAVSRRLGGKFRRHLRHLKSSLASEMDEVLRYSKRFTSRPFDDDATPAKAPPSSGDVDRFIAVEASLERLNNRTAILLPGLTFRRSEPIRDFVFLNNKEGDVTPEEMVNRCRSLRPSDDMGKTTCEPQHSLGILTFNNVAFATTMKLRGKSGFLESLHLDISRRWPRGEFRRQSVQLIEDLPVKTRSSGPLNRFIDSQAPIEVANLDLEYPALVSKNGAKGFGEATLVKKHQEEKCGDKGAWTLQARAAAETLFKKKNLQNIIDDSFNAIRFKYADVTENKEIFVYVIDNFPPSAFVTNSPQAKLFATTGLGILAHIDFLSQSEAASFKKQTLCLRHFDEASDKRPKDEGHGTHVAAIIGARRNGFGTHGVAPDAVLAVLRPKKNADGILTLGEVQDQLKSISAKWNSGFRTWVINLSHAFKQGVTTSNIRALHQRVQATHDRFLIVAANMDEKGNRKSGGTCHILPACLSTLPNVITVAALGENPHRDPKLWEGSDFGDPHITLVAPGTDILSADENNWYSLRTGSSMAAAFVSGVAANLLHKAPDLKPYQVKQRLVATSTFFYPKGETRRTLGGVVNMNRAINDTHLDVVTFHKIGEPELKGELIVNDQTTPENYWTLRMVHPKKDRVVFPCHLPNLLRIDYSRKQNKATLVCRNTDEENNESIKVHHNLRFVDSSNFTSENCIRREREDAKKAKANRTTCFSLKPTGGGDSIPVLLEEVRNIYFGIRTKPGQN